MAAPGAAIIPLFGGPTVLIAGGASGDVVNHTEEFTGIATAQTYFRLIGRFVSTRNAPAAFAYPTSTTLLDGTVLFAGGFGTAEPVRTAAIYNFSRAVRPDHRADDSGPGRPHCDAAAGRHRRADRSAASTAWRARHGTAEAYHPSTGLFRRTKGAPRRLTLAGPRRR